MISLPEVKLLNYYNMAVDELTCKPKAATTANSADREGFVLDVFPMIALSEGGRLDQGAQQAFDSTQSNLPTNREESGVLPFGRYGNLYGTSSLTSPPFVVV